MSRTATEPALLPPADETMVRRHSDELRQMAARYGVNDLPSLWAT